MNKYAIMLIKLGIRGGGSGLVAGADFKSVCDAAILC